MMNLINILLIGWLILQLPEIYSIVKTNFNLWALIRVLFSCFKCIAFWVGLIYTQDILVAAEASFIAYMLDLYIFKRDFEL